MKVLLITPVPPQDKVDGGLATVLFATLRGLVDDGHDVTLVTPAGPHAVEFEAVSALRCEGFTVHAAPRHTGDDRWRRRCRMAWRWLRGDPWRTVWFSEPALQAVIDRLVATQRFDVIDVQDSAMAGYTLPSAIPKVLTDLEVRRNRPTNFRRRGSLSWPAFLFAEFDWRRWPEYQRRSWSRYDAVTVLTARDAATLTLIAPELADRVHVVPFGIVPPIPGSDHEIEPSTIAFIGNYTHAPNVDAALWLVEEILPIVRRVAPDAMVRLAGPSAPAAIRSLASDTVDVLGWVDDADEFLRRATVVVAPVRTGGGMRVKVLHAMALGKALVTTSRGAEGLSDEDRTAIAIADDADAFGAVVGQLLSDSAGRAAIGAQARRVVIERYGVVPAARRVVAVYETIVAERNLHP